mgnify:FL=1
MSHAVQLRLLRVLDAKEVMHVGGRSLHSRQRAGHLRLAQAAAGSGQGGLVQAGSVFPSGGRLP